MLKRIVVGNFKSFDEVTDLNMVASPISEYSFADKNFIDKRAIRASLPILLLIPSQSPPIME